MRALAIVVGLTVSLLLHGSVLAAVLFLMDPDPGAGPLPTEAISIEIIPSHVLEATLMSPSPDASSSVSAIDSDPGALEDVATTSAERPEAVEMVEERAPTVRQFADAPVEAPRAREIPVDERDDLREPAEPAFRQAATAVEPDEAARAEAPPPQPVEPTERAQPPQPRQLHKEPMKRGGAPSRATKGSASFTGRVSASPGAAINYAAAVRARVASRRPPGAGQRGTVVVTFGVTRSGGLVFASILRSSGDPTLDRSVLSAVRSASPFPMPPPGASPSQLRFSMPFYFQ